MRAFIAAWPDDATRGRLARVLDQLPVADGARAMQPRNLHLTLAFIGELDTVRAESVAQVCSALRPQQFDWSVDQLGWFARARVAWLGGPVSEAMVDAVRAARAALDRLGVGFDRKPFVPHVTVLRDVRHFDHTGPLEALLAWRTTHVALYASARDRNGPVYRRVPAAS